MKSVFKVLLAVLWSSLLVACSGGGEITNDPDAPDEPVEPLSIELSISNDQISAVGEDVIVTAKVTDTGTGAGAATLVTFSLNDPSYGTFTPATGQVSTNADGVATIKITSAEINTGATITATTTTGESASINVTMVGDGGQAGEGAQVSLQLTNADGEPIQTISTLSPGKLTATVTGVSQATIVTFDSPIGDLPVKTAVTDVNGQATVDIYAGSSLGAGEASASLSTNEVGTTIVVVGATNVVMGSGEPFVEGVAEVSTDELSAGGTATITVLIQDDNGTPFNQPVDVNFSSTCATKVPAQAEISSPVSSSNGVATSTYLAKGCVGEDQINVTANAGGISLSAAGIINVLPSEVGSIAFVSAEPENIGILGTGGIESSVVKFRVLDKNSNPVSNQNVLFALNTQIGGVELKPTEATTNNEGIVQTVVTTGTVATSVRVTATVDNDVVPAITSQSKQLIISTGIPDQDSFSLSAEILNPEGWDVEGTPVKVTARMADAFNNPVPDGTTVSFTTEGGAIEDACQTVNGACSVTWVSQSPRPEGQTLFDGSGTMLGNPESELVYDSALGIYGNFYGQNYGGRATVTATAIGEESFPDLNGNGRFDADEYDAFVGTPPYSGKDVSGEWYDLNDAFNDYNEDGLFNPQQAGGQTGGELEELIDFNSNGLFDLKDGLYNGVLCSTPVHAGCADGISNSKSVFVRRSLTLVMSGSTAYATNRSDIVINDKDGEHTNEKITIVGKGSASAAFTISDRHNQQMPAGSVVKFVATAGSVVSSSEVVWPSSNYNGGRDFSVTVKGEDEPNSGVLLVTVTSPLGLETLVVSIPITIE